MTWPAAERLGGEGAIGLVTLAALEQHGPHLPLATDSLLGERLAREVAERLPGPVVVTPVVRGGLSTHHLAFAGSVTVPPNAYRALVVSYLEGLERTGIRKVAVFSSHGGNFGFVRDLTAEYDGDLTLAGYSDLERFLEVMMAAAAEVGLQAPETDVHAGGLETSMMLAAYSGLVRPFDGVEGYTAAEPGWLQRIFEDIRPVSEAASSATAARTPRSATPSSRPWLTSWRPTSRASSVCKQFRYRVRGPELVGQLLGSDEPRAPLLHRDEHTLEHRDPAAPADRLRMQHEHRERTGIAVGVVGELVEPDLLDVSRVP